MYYIHQGYDTVQADVKQYSNLTNTRTQAVPDTMLCLSKQSVGLQLGLPHQQLHTHTHTHT
jgi:hypothetical protein